jgi:hypothetical protein
MNITYFEIITYFQRLFSSDAPVLAFKGQQGHSTADDNEAAQCNQVHWNTIRGHIEVLQDLFPGDLHRRQTCVVTRRRHSLATRPEAVKVKESGGESSHVIVDATNPDYLVLSIPTLDPKTHST